MLLFLTRESLAKSVVLFSEGTLASFPIRCFKSAGYSKLSQQLLYAQTEMLAGGLLQGSMESLTAHVFSDVSGMYCLD